jgi:hypothetical protein
MAGYTYYPSAYTDDWITCFETYEEAKNKIETFDFDLDGNYLINNKKYDWYDIVDLKNWIEQ